MVLRASIFVAKGKSVMVEPESGSVALKSTITPPMERFSGIVNEPPETISSGGSLLVATKLRTGAQLTPAELVN